MDEQKIILPINNLNKLTQKDKEKSLQFLSEKAKLIFADYIREVYTINSRLRQKQNYVPLEHMIEAIHVEYSINPLSFSIFLEESDIVWKDIRGENIYAIEDAAEETVNVTDLWSHWQTPIQGKQEEDWIIESSIRSIKHFINTDYVKYLNKLGGK